MFYAEIEGLDLIGKSGCIQVPNPCRVAVDNEDAVLLMPFIPPGRPSNEDWKTFGHQLAQMHKTSRPTFGLNWDNYIGTLEQRNTPETDWSAFYANHRIIPLIELALDKALIEGKTIRQAHRFCNSINELFPNESPGLIHGDLWSGNFIFDEEGAPYLIDPAVYYGHREMDIATSRLFGGFQPGFYEAYHETFPMEVGWEDRLAYGQLYYLLVHLVLFGRSYFQSVDRILSKF